MKLNRESRRQARELFALSMVDGRIDPDRLRLIADTLVERKPRDYVGMLKFLARLARMENDRHHAVVESATPLDSPSADSITASLSAKFGPITSEFRHNPDLIGGLRIRLGSNVWDGSVRSRLESLKQS